MLVSIGLVTHNNPQLLRRALSSLARQDYRPLEIIVSESNPGCVESEALVREFNDAGMFRYFRHPDLVGARANFRHALVLATGRYFMWHADDDWYNEDDAVSQLVRSIQRHDARMVFGDANYHYEKNTALNRQRVMSRIYRSDMNDEEMLLAWCGCQEGDPVYGLYNLTKLSKDDVTALFDDFMPYHVENRGLTKLFIGGGVRFVDTVTRTVMRDPDKPDMPLSDRFRYYVLSAGFVIEALLVSNLEPAIKNRAIEAAWGYVSPTIHRYAELLPSRTKDRFDDLEQKVALQERTIDELRRNLEEQSQRHEVELQSVKDALEDARRKLGRAGEKSESRKAELVQAKARIKALRQDLADAKKSPLRKLGKFLRGKR